MIADDHARAFTGKSPGCKELAQRLLSVAHIAAAVVLLSAARAANPIGRGLTAFAAVLAALDVRERRKGVNAANPQEAYDYYMHLWSLFFLSYLALPFAR